MSGFFSSRWPIVIGGVHRSGTSLVRRILDAHSHIYCGPEIKFFKDWYSDYVNVEDPVKHARFIQSARSLLPEAELMLVLGRAFIGIHERAAQLHRKRRWADKSPENVLYLGDWERLLGRNWLFVQVVRNPLDTLASIDEVNFQYTIPVDLEGRIEHYCRYSEAGLSYMRTHPERSYRLVYEQLAASPREEVQALMRWLGEQPEDAQLDFNALPHQAGLEDPKTAATRAVHSESVGRWRTRFSAAETQFILARTGELWKQLDARQGYVLEEAAQKATGG